MTDWSNCHFTWFIECRSIRMSVWLECDCARLHLNDISSNLACCSTIQIFSCSWTKVVDVRRLLPNLNSMQWNLCEYPIVKGVARISHFISLEKVGIEEGKSNHIFRGPNEELVAIFSRLCRIKQWIFEPPIKEKWGLDQYLYSFPRYLLKLRKSWWDQMQ